MAGKSETGGIGALGWGVVAGGLALAGFAGLYYSGFLSNTGPDTNPAEQTEVASVPTEIVDQPETESDTPEAVADDTTDTEVVAAPELDQIFVERDGVALLSGVATEGSRVAVLLDGTEIHSFEVGETGKFAEFVTIPFSDAARGLVLETDVDGQTVRSDDYLIAALPEPEPQEEQIASADIGDSTAPESDDDTAQTTAEGDGTVTEDATAGTGGEAVAQTEAGSTPASTEDASEASGNQVAILRSGEEGVELLQPTEPPSEDAGEQVALDTIGYSDAGEVELSGRVQDGSVVRLYLDNQLVADITPNEQGRWQGEIEGIDPGVYTLRLDEVDPQGEVVSRLETPFKREPVEVLRPSETAETEGQTQAPAIRAVTVQEGDTLWAISRERYGDGILYVKVFEANRGAIRDPDLIYPGQIFTIPE